MKIKVITSGTYSRRLGPFSMKARSKSVEFGVELIVDIQDSLFPSVVSGTIEDKDWDHWGEQDTKERLSRMLEYAFGEDIVEEQSACPIETAEEYIRGRAFSYIIDGIALKVFG